MVEAVVMIDTSGLVTGVTQDLIVTAITAIIGILFVKKYTSDLIFSNQMHKMGFDSALLSHKLKRKKNIFANADVIKIINVSGLHYLNDNEQLLCEAMKKGTKVKFMCAAPYNEFLSNIEMLEKNAGLRSDSLISAEIFDIIEKFSDEKNFEMRFYTSSYRLPIVIVEYSNGTKKGWLTVTLPPYKSTKSFMLTGRSLDGNFEQDINFIEMMTTHFDTVWNYASCSIDEFKSKIVSRKQAEWGEKYDEAKKFMETRTGGKVLIEVAAQHPLINGTEPNEEFRGRLDKALTTAEIIGLQNVYFYVPGNLHSENGVQDKCTLSDVGKEYLIKHGISSERIYGHEYNNIYKGEKGVYNSTDECYVASCIFKSDEFKEMICVCSPAQMLRKVFSYIGMGLVPQIEVFSCIDMYHNYIEEFFRAVPIVVNDLGMLTGDSLEAERLRKERKL